jgi:protein-histidine pros-kinase
VSEHAVAQGPDWARSAFGGLLEAAPDAMLVVDEAGRIVLVNRQVLTMFGYRRDELVGQPVEALIPPAARTVHATHRQGYVATPRVRMMGTGLDLRASRKDGSEFPVEVSLSPMGTPEGLLVCAAIRDVSERRSIEEATARAKDEFFATVSHELRPPLTSLIGYGELLNDLEKLSEQGRRFLAVMLRSAERELRLVDDLLTLVQIEEGGLSIIRTPLDVLAVVTDAVEAARPRAEESGLDLRLEAPAHPVPVDGDSDRLGQAVDNLLSNALKFTPPTGRVTVVLRVEDGHAVIEVSDTGPGVGIEDVDRLFERLYRASNAVEQQVPGAGLGLTITLAIVEAHHGTISIPRSDDFGTTFRIVLPLRVADPAAVAGLGSPELAAG